MAGPGVEILLNQLASTETADVYFSPNVQQINQTTGVVTDPTLPSSSPLNISVSYANQQPDNFTGQSSGASSPAQADATPVLPTLVYPPAATATFVPQTSTTGDAAISLTNLPAGSTLTNVVLSDVAGLEWVVV